MKTILVPIDFSPASLNALDYAVEMALHTKSGIILFHVYNNISPALDIPVVAPAWPDIEENSKKELKKIEKKIERKYGKDLSVQSICKCGFTVEEINNFTKENSVDLVIMATHGTGYIEERLIGSTTTALIRKSHCPIISVHQEQKFKPIKKIAMACDYDETDADQVLSPLKELANIFHTHIYLLHVIPEFDTCCTLSEQVKLNTALKEIKHSSYSIVEGNVVERINSFVETHGIDMVVMIPRKHSFFDNIVYEPDTKRMAFHAKVPLLSLHE
jgi:nucleotide-binding universal stress UspA family protein